MFNRDTLAPDEHKVLEETNVSIFRNTVDSIETHWHPSTNLHTAISHNTVILFTQEFHRAVFYTQHTCRRIFPITHSNYAGLLHAKNAQKIPEGL
jgi:hypothetical protein